jgi:hypothetical protein
MRNREIFVTRRSIASRAPNLLGAARADAMRRSRCNFAAQGREAAGISR